MLHHQLLASPDALVRQNRHRLALLRPERSDLALPLADGLVLPKRCPCLVDLDSLAAKHRPFFAEFIPHIARHVLQLPMRQGPRDRPVWTFACSRRGRRELAFDRWARRRSNAAFGKLQLKRAAPNVSTILSCPSRQRESLSRRSRQAPCLLALIHVLKMDPWFPRESRDYARSAPSELRERGQAPRAVHAKPMRPRWFLPAPPRA